MGLFFQKSNSPSKRCIFFPRLHGRTGASGRSLTSVRSLLVLAALGQRAVGPALFHFHHSSAGAAGKHKDMLL